MVELPEIRKVLKWIFKVKIDVEGNTVKYKARLVAKGYLQGFGIDYEEMFAPVSMFDIIKLILAIAEQRQWRIYQLDVKSAFLNRELNEEVYMEQPEGYI